VPRHSAVGNIKIDPWYVGCKYILN